MAETPCCTQTSHLCLLYVRSYCRLKFFLAWIGNFGYWLGKMVENIIYFIRTAKLIKMIPKHIFWPIIYCFSIYVTGVRPTRIQGVVSRRSSPNRCVWWLGHVTKMAVTPFYPALLKSPCYTQTSRLYVLQNRSYCRPKFYIAWIGNSAFFAKTSGNYFLKILRIQKWGSCRWSTFSDRLF